MRTIWMSLLAAALLSACAGTPPEEQAGATVEDRTPGALKPGAQTKPVQDGQVAKVDLTQGKPPAGYSILRGCGLSSFRAPSRRPEHHCHPF